MSEQSAPSTNMRARSPQLAILALLFLFSPVIPAAAQCSCANDCANCNGCAPSYVTPLATCDKCYTTSAVQGKLICTFSGTPTSSTGPAAKNEGQGGGFGSGFHFQLPGTRYESKVYDFR